jgi:hypothetical protein
MHVPINISFRLSLLPPVEVSDCFVLDFKSNLPNDKLGEQCGYCVLENCIDASSIFPPPAWSEISASSFRTTNVKASYSNFNAPFYSVHPNIFVLASALQKNTD